ncbi:hypothetical protein E2542_SST09080 [Spatholobus suberectus]|nr:hypothetical protein E2542_SST09080 [Spatholobus suberectus]
MAAQAKNFHLKSHSKIVSKNTSLRVVLEFPVIVSVAVPFLMREARLKERQKAELVKCKREELLKALLRKGTIDKGNMNKGKNMIESKQVNDSKKKSISGHNQQNHGVKELLKVVTKGTEKLNINESKSKSGTHSKLCSCAPTTHEGSFKCRLHRKKSTTDKSNPTFGTDDSLTQKSGVDPA